MDPSLNHRHRQSKWIEKNGGVLLRGKYVSQELRRHFFTTTGIQQKMKVVQQRAIKNEIKTLVRNTKQQNR